jgi:hypothetical protein
MNEKKDETPDHSPKSYFIDNPAIYIVKYDVKWNPINKLSLRVEPSTIITKLPTSVVVYSQDFDNQILLMVTF